MKSSSRIQVALAGLALALGASACGTTASSTSHGQEGAKLAEPQDAHTQVQTEDVRLLLS